MVSDLEANLDGLLSADKSWITLTLVPDSPGPTRMTPEKFEEIKSRHLNKIICGGWWDTYWNQVFAGMSKAQLYSDFRQDEDSPEIAFAELHADGSGTFAGYLPEVNNGFEEKDEEGITTLSDEQLAEWVLGGLGTLLSHSQHMGAGSSFLVRGRVRGQSGVEKFSLGQKRNFLQRSIGNYVRRLDYSEQNLELTKGSLTWPLLIRHAQLVLQDLSQSLGYVGDNQFTNSGTITLDRWQSDALPKIENWARKNEVETVGPQGK